MYLRSFFRPACWVAFAASAGLSVSAVAAELVLVANDNNVVTENGVQVVVKNPAPDTFAVIDLAGPEPRLVAEIEGVPASVIGPPVSIAVTPNGQIALVTATNKLDPENPTRQVADNRMTVVDLTSMPPRVIATLETGRMPSGVSINPAGTLALVGNFADGTVSIFAIEGKTVTPAGNLRIAGAEAGVRFPMFLPDGKHALLTRDSDHTLTLLKIDGRSVTLAGRDIRPGFKPYAADVKRDGSIAVVGNVGFLTGDTDTVSVIDLRAQPPRAVDSISVGQTPETLRLSPDGTLCAVVLLNGSTKPKDSPFYSTTGKLALYRVEGTKLVFADSAPIGAWPQGTVISSDNKTILVTSMAERAVHVFRWDGTRLVDTKKPIKMKGGPTAMTAVPR